MPPKGKKIPVTILTGFLGAGKTTLLNHILSEMHGLKLAVIQNEFGEVGVDEHLVQQNVKSDEQVIEMMNGCICCTVRGDLSKIIKKLLIEQKRWFDGILIETTGMADPAPVAQTFFVDEDVTSVTTLDGIITVVDARHIIQHLKQDKPEGVQNESVQQIAFADRIIINKTDLVNAEQLALVYKQVQSINSSVQIIQSQYSRVDPKQLLGLEAFKLEKVLKMDPQFLNLDQQHIHDQSVSSCGCIITEPLNLGKLQNWIQYLINEKANDLFRYKGIINVVGMKSPYVFQGVHMLFTGHFIANGWEQTKSRQSRFCFIGKNIDKQALIKGFKDCIAQQLMFKVGDKVEAKVQSGANGWKQGVIIKLWDQGNAYRIKLKNGTQVHCPYDTDQLIRLKQAVKNILSEQKKSELLYKVQQIKESGNKYFTLQKYNVAMAEYVKGIQLINKNVENKLKQNVELIDIYLRLKKNLALCKIRLFDFNSAIVDCDYVLEIEPEDSKAFYMKGQAFMGMKKFKEAKQCFEKADGSNVQVRAALQKCLKQLK